jgi:hypothetical protein
MSPSWPREQTSLPWCEPAPASSAPSPAPTPAAATPTIPSRPATAPSELAGAPSAAARSAAAPPTAPSEQLRMPSTSTDLRALLAIPRPRTRGECRNGERPCPWAACEHHLLIDRGERTGTARRGAANTSPGMALNLPRARGGRRQRLASAAAAELVRVWIDDAVEVLWGMPDSCELDVAERGEASPREVQQHTGRSAAGARAIYSTAWRRLQTSAHEEERAQ